MALKDLEPKEIEVIGRALALMARGELIEEWEFHSRMGVDLNELRGLLNRWPDWDDMAGDSSECLAINNTLNDLIHGIAIGDELCNKKIGVPVRELLRIYTKWAALRGWSSTGLR